MNLVDLLVLLLLAISALLGLSRGLVRELLGLGAWILAGYGAWQYGPLAIPMADQAIGNPDIAQLVAYIGVFVLMLIILSLLANLVGRIVRVSTLGGLDRTLGLVFGLLRGAAVAVALYIPAALAYHGRLPDVAMRAWTVPIIRQGAEWVVARLPKINGVRFELPPDTTPTTTADDLLHATPEGRALGPPIGHP